MVRDTLMSMAQVTALAASATSTDTIVQIITVIFNAVITIFTIYARCKQK